jgi:hypothetical protein
MQEHGEQQLMSAKQSGGVAKDCLRRRGPPKKCNPDSFGGVRSAGISGMSGSEQDKVDQLIKLLEKEKPLSASDVAAVQKLLAAGAGVVNGRGESFK